MKPLNAVDKGCNFISSNCVIWAGPDIPCINICTGDSVSDVVYKLALELCDVLDTLDISKYDLSCLNITTCAPKNFHDFIQLMIQTICNLQACCNGQGGTGNRTVTSITSGQIPVAPCFYYTNPFGDQVTTMTVEEYITAIGNRTCNLQTRMTSVESTLAIHTDEITIIQNQLLNPPPVVLPTVTPVCVLPPFPTEMDQVLAALELQYCQLLGATGLPSEIYTAIAKQCANLGLLPVLGGGTGNMAGLPGWNTLNNNAAATINNMWLTVCDLRSAVQNIKINCCTSDCDGIALNLTATFLGSSLTLFVTGTIPPGFSTCSPSGTAVTITDDNGGSSPATFDIVAFLNNPSGFIINITGTPLNPLSNLHIHMEPCLKNLNTNATCQSCLEYTVINVTNCPIVAYTPTTDSISYVGTPLPGTAQYTVEIWDNLGATLIVSQVQMATAPTAFTGNFTGLTSNTTYKLRALVTVNGITTTCQFVSIPLIISAIPPVELGATSTFAILAGGGVTDTSGPGASVITGDVGSDPTVTITGLVAGDVIGGYTLYTAFNATVANAKTALLNAIADASARIPYVTLGSNDLGGVTLTPGYYDTPGGLITLTAGAFTFDALGDPNAVIIIKATTTLNTTAVTSVSLAGGAQAKNIFWLIGTNATLGANSFFKGTILADNTISVGINTSIEGRLLATTGLVTIDTNTITLP